MIKILYLANIIICNYHLLIKNPQNFNNNINYGVLGGTINNYIDINNEFMITFWFKFTNFSNNIFPFISFHGNSFIFNEYNIYKQLNQLSSNNFSSKLDVNINTNYFLKIRGILKNNNLTLDLYLFDSINSIQNLNFTKTIDYELKDLIFIINRYNIEEELLIEKIIFYNTINEYTDEELINGVVSVLYFINFKNNYINTKWFMNEIKNEFGPSLNGINDDYVNRFSGNFNELTKEIEWISSSINSEINLNPILITYVNQFELNHNFNIFLKFDFWVFNKSSITRTSFIYPFLFIFNHNVAIKLDYNMSDSSIEVKFIYSVFINSTRYEFVIYHDRINTTNIISSKNYGIKFILINFFKNFNDVYKLETNILGSIPINNNYLRKFQISNSQIDKINTTIKIFISNNFSDNLLLAIILKEFTFGIGNIIVKNINNNYILNSKNIVNPFLIYNNQIEDLDRRGSFDKNIAHSPCEISNCSICRQKTNKCEYCYRNHYLDNNTCVLNNSNVKFVNNYSILKNKSNSKNSYNKINNERYNIWFSLSNPSTYSLFNINIKLKYNNLMNLLISIKTTNCIDKLNIFFNKINNNESEFNLVVPFNLTTCINNYDINNFNNLLDNNDLTDFQMNISVNSFDCNLQFKDVLCNLGCSRDNSFFIKFNNSLYYSTCNNNDIKNFVKNKGFFKYYYNCPINCTNCEIDVNNLLKCTQCENGYMLKNNECILKLFIDCTLGNYNLSNNHTNFNWFTCNNLCTFLNNKINSLNLIRYYKNSQECTNKDKLVLKCKNNSYYNKFEKKCTSCLNTNCLDFVCNNCNQTNNLYPCSINFTFFKYKCISNINYNDKCIDYILNQNTYICNKCVENYYIDNNTSNYKCIQRNTINCSKYVNNSIICEICKEGFYINNSKLCEKCDINCKNCIINSINCTSCLFNYNLISGKCVFNKIYEKNCKNLNSSKICSKCNIGYYIGINYICEKCSEKCLDCEINKNKCLSCKKTFILNNNFICIDKIKNCNILTDYKTCKQCYSGYFINTNNTWSKCNEKCLNCEKNELNCTKCFDNGVLINNKEFKICKYKCKEINYRYSIKQNQCILCEIKNIKEFKIYKPNFNYDKDKLKQYNYYNEIKNLKYFIIIDIPLYLTINNLNLKNIKLNTNLKIKNKKMNYLLFLDFQFKKLLLIPILDDIYLEHLNIDLVLNNNFTNYNSCKFKVLKKSFVIENYNKKFNNEIEKLNEKNFPTFDKKSQEFKTLEKYYEITKTTTNTVLLTTIVFSFFSPPILANLSIFLPTLWFFSYLTLLNINYDKVINTILSLINFNSKIYDLSEYIYINKKNIEKKLYKIKYNISKIKKIKIIYYYKVTLNYLILAGLLITRLILKLLKYLVIFLKIILKKFFMKKRKNLKINDIVSTNNNNDIYTFRNGVYYSLSRKFKIKLFVIKSNMLLDYLNNKIYLIFLGILSTEIPNILFFSTINISIINIDFLSINTLIIISLMIYNTSWIVYYFSKIYYIILNINIINSTLKSIKRIFIPYKLKNKRLKYYLKMNEYIKLLFSIIIIIYLRYNIIIQITLILILQLIYIIYLTKIIETWSLILLLYIKELNIALFLILTLAHININNYYINIILWLNLIWIFFFSIIEFIWLIIKNYYRKISLILKKFKIFNKRNKIKNIK